MNSRHADKLELLSATPKKPRPGAPPLLFLHGAYTAAWCWQEYSLPFFAAAGFHSHALSFSGHGASRRREHLDHYSISNYVEDVVETIAGLPAPPVLIGHSMGGFVLQKYLEEHAAPAAILMCSVPPQGLAASAIGMLFGHPSVFADLNQLMSGGEVSIDGLRNALFAQPVALKELTRYYHLAQPESHRAIWDMMLFNLPRPNRVLAHLPDGREDLLILGAEQDIIIPASLVEMTARSYGARATIFPDMGHGLMLEADWRIPAQAMLDWLRQRFP